MKYTYLRFITTLFVALIITVSGSVFFFNKLITSFGEPMMTFIHTDENYDYTLQIPDYWVGSENENYDIYFAGGNYEYMSFKFEDITSGYDRLIAQTTLSMKLKDKYSADLKINEKTFDGKYIYFIEFSNSDYNFVTGFIENDGFITEFEYKMQNSNIINQNLFGIATSVERFSKNTEEVTSENN